MDTPADTDDSPRLVWYALDVLIEAPAREATEYGLMEAGALGTETNDDGAQTTVRGYFDRKPDIEMVRAALVDALSVYNLASAALIEMALSEVPDRDWLAEWKKSWQPVQVGRFIIAPPWLVSEPGADRGPRAGSPREVVDATGSSEPIESIDPVANAPGTDTIVIRINPGMAFGTGTHETTRLCLKAIEKHYVGGSFLDVGTGTGILAITAAKCQKPEHEAGRSLITACDTDADAINIARENAELNDVGDQIDFRVGTVDDDTASADLVCANLTAPVIVELLPQLIGATCGRLILSGILDSQIEMVRTRLLELAVVDFEVDQDGEWVSITA
jgi:ribosomal protein L11 methyltransferase